MQTFKYNFINGTCQYFCSALHAEDYNNRKKAGTTLVNEDPANNSNTKHRQFIMNFTTCITHKASFIVKIL